MDSLAEALYILLRNQMEDAIAQKDLSRIRLISEIAEMNDFDLLAGTEPEFETLEEAQQYLEVLLDLDE